jgi:hypothetical protein
MLLSHAEYRWRYGWDRSHMILHRRLVRMPDLQNKSNHFCRYGTFVNIFRVFWDYQVLLYLHLNILKSQPRLSAALCIMSVLR